MIAEIQRAAEAASYIDHPQPNRLTIKFIVNFTMGAERHVTCRSLALLVVKSFVKL